ncbi:hypothetical protein [Parendozoicomonas haliclonae]|uniref:Uncharacterized protein n=1 Tax=Parendozoicomonas haliclonae TaxID=1960125 RepID=A0A1X7AH13_9GAMM|nr:hypothetical protein [Parendozoicomonas haliclonae]SMA41741.1 hypothetical protein EHSB41UT_01316 [Parendozoicomonas haliclonae]
MSQTHPYKYYLLNAHQPCLWFHLDNPEHTLDIHQLCQFSGPTSPTFHPEDDLATDQPIALIEHITALHHPDKLPGSKHLGTLLYFGGNLADSLMHWLMARQRAPEIWLFPEYDDVGMANWLKLKSAIPHAQLFIPDDIEQRFKTAQHSSKPRRWEDHPLLDSNNLKKTNDAGVLQILELVNTYGYALSQSDLISS